jgi:hypothetical protein
VTGIRDQFYRKTHDLAIAIAKNLRPLTFVLGAGASLSSGAPATPLVHTKLVEATEGRFEGRVREFLHELTLREVREHLLPLFEHVVPDVGYRLMAALGRQRRINAIVLNWDDALEQACRATGTPYAFFDPLRDGDIAAKEAELPDGRGVLIVHVHGTLRDARYAFLDTLPDHPEIWATIAPLLQHDTIICGASLSGDLDVAHVMQRLQNSGRDDAATWLYVRPGGDPPPVPIPPAWQVVESQQVDFDDLMIMLAEEALAATGQKLTRWNELVDDLPFLELPTIEKLVELAPEVRRHALAARVAGLIAPPFSGKSVGAVRLGHLRRLIDGVEQPLRVNVDLQDSPAELAISAELEDVVVVIDDPFGSNDAQANPRVRAFLLALAAADGGYACVSSPVANWKAEAGALLEEPSGLYVAPQHAAEWYERDRLARLGGQLAHPKPAVRGAQTGKLQTPPEVLEVGRTGQPVDTERLVADKRRLLDHDDTLGLLCSIVRLQERAGSPISAAELSAILGCEPSEIKRIDAVLVPQHLGATSFWVFNHSTSGQATDSYLSSHLAEVRERLEQAKVLPAWTDHCLAGWALANGEPSSLAENFDQEAVLEPADWMAQRLGSRPTEELMSSMTLEPSDEWATLDFAYEVVRVWDSIKKLPSGQQLLDDLSARPMGLYGLLEGCLYFGVAANDQLWARLMDRLYKLPNDPSRCFEMLLILDAVLWRAPHYEPLGDWATETIDGLSPEAEEFAFVRFAAGYHAAGLAALDVKDALAADATHAWTPEQAALGARLVAWHFAHQSRARVLLHRRSDLDKQWLCQALGQVELNEEAAPEPALRLIRSLADFPETAGWGFHLGCNLAVIGGLDLHQEEARAAAEKALKASPKENSGVTSAVVAYRSADLFSRDLRKRFEDQDELNELLTAMGAGIEISDGTKIQPPRFRFVDDPTAVYDAIGQKFPKLDAELPREPVQLAAGLWRAAAEILDGQTRGVRRHISVLIERVGRGDLQPVLVQTRLKDPIGDPYADAVLRMLHDPDLKPDTLF